MKTLVLVLIFLIIPLSAQAQASNSSLCSMDMLHTAVLANAKDQFEALIRDSLVGKFEVSENIQIDPRKISTEANDLGEGASTDIDYFLNISNIRIKTARGNFLNLSIPVVALHGMKPVLGDDFDNEGVRVGQTCGVNFTVVFDPVVDIINAKTQHFVTRLIRQTISVSVGMPVSAK